MKELENKTILITGATGFIGSHLARKLVTLGENVSIIIRKDSDTTKIRDIIPFVSIYVVDLRDFHALREVINEIRPQKIFHLAAYTKVDRTFSHIDDVIDTNIKGTVNLLHALEDCNFECFINTGTCEEYGDNPVPFHESQPLNPVSPYSASKSATTLFCKMFSKTMAYPIVTVRPFLSYGPYQDENRLIPQAIIAALEKREFKMTGGVQTREFNYISDIVGGFIRASKTKEAIGKIVNIGNGVEYKIKDVVEMILDMVGNSTKPLIGALPYRPGEAMHFYCDNRRAKRLLDWEPKVDIQSGLRMTIQWYKKKWLVRHSEYERN